MQNPFETIEVRLDKIEALLTELNRNQLASPVLSTGESRYGDFEWYVSETKEAKSSARQRIARGEVPGITKLGRRLLFDKEVIRRWISENQRKTSAQLACSVDESFTRRHVVKAANTRTR